MVPGPVLSKSVRNEELPVSTRPPAAGLPPVVPGFRSDGKALVIAEFGTSVSRLRRRRTSRKATSGMPMTARPPAARYMGSMSSYHSFGGGAAFFGAAGGGAGLVSAGLGVSAGF